ncbi:MAG: metallophosphoesterase family protein [Limnochordia bacterium]|nr:metallophosphoesterase family protein [Limnochordia bacterium]
MRLNRHRKLLTIGSLVLVTILLQVSFAAAEDFPRGLHLSWQNDPATTMTLMWRSEPGAEGVVEYGVSSEYTHSVDSETHGYRYGRTDIFWHTVEITGLEPNTTYHYRVKTSEPWTSEDYTFKTGILYGEDTFFRVAVITDAHGGYDRQKEAFAMIKDEDVDFIIGLGDFTDTGNQVEWDLWFASGEGVLSGIPLMAVHGNHEGNQGTYWDQFAFPGNERWFSMNYGNTHFVFLMAASEPLALEQVPWLLEDLQSNDSAWTIAMGHIPIYSSGLNHGSSPYLIQHWAGIFDEYGVSLYLAGHNHCYERSLPIKADKLDPEGVIYMTHGPVGDKLYSVGNEWWSATTLEGFSMYSIYSFEGSRIRGTAKTLDGTVVDEFVLEHPGF